MSEYGEFIRYRPRERYTFVKGDPRAVLNDIPLIALRRRGEPTWEYCEVCRRETPHRSLNSMHECIYVDLVHVDCEYSHETCTWRDTLQPLSMT